MVCVYINENKYTCVHRNSPEVHLEEAEDTMMMILLLRASQAHLHFFYGR